MQRWFGESWGAPVCDPDTHTATPVGAVCGWCGEPIAASDSGFIMSVAAENPYDIAHHRNCFLRSVLGSVGHQNGRCSCHDDEGNGDPPGMTTRQAADAAVELFFGERT